VMNRRGPVFADRYHSHLLKSPREAAQAVRYVLENLAVHARREGWTIPRGADPYCSAAPHDRGPPPVVEPVWWMLRVGVERVASMKRAA
jgi:putative transposase